MNDRRKGGNWRVNEKGVSIILYEIMGGD